MASLASHAAAEPVVVETTELFHSEAASVVGIPQNNGAFWDGQRYWLIYSEGGTLKAKVGPTLAAMRDTPTDPAGEGNLTGLVNDKTFSVAFGRHDGDWHAWALLNRTGADGGTPFDIVSWRLDADGLREGRSRNVRIGNKHEPSHVMLMPEIESKGEDGWEVDALLGAVTGRPDGAKGGHKIAIRRISPDLSSDTALGGVSMAGAKFPEAAWAYRLHDGYLFTTINTGDWPPPPPRPAAFSEWRRGTLDAAWSDEDQLEGPGSHHWMDQNYAADTSHAGQTDAVQLVDGRVFNAYIDDTDHDRGNFGRVILKARGPALDDRWETAAVNAVPQDGRAWHVALTSDGRRVWLLYVADAGGKRAAAITLRGYDPPADTWTDPVAIATTTDGRRFERMTTQWRFTDGRLVVLWSQTDDAGAFYVHATAVRVGGI